MFGVQKAQQVKDTGQPWAERGAGIPVQDPDVRELASMCFRRAEVQKNREGPGQGHPHHT